MIFEIIDSQVNKVASKIRSQNFKIICRELSLILEGIRYNYLYIPLE